MVTSAEIAGIGWVTPLGTSIEGAWQRLMAGETGFVEGASNLRLRNRAFAPTLQIREPEQRFFDLASKAISNACIDAQVDLSSPDLHVVLGSSLAFWIEAPHEGIDASTCNRLAQELGLHRLPTLVCSACSSSSDAVAVGTELVKADAPPLVICGGVDIVTPAKMLAHSALSTLTRSRPRAFDRTRDGMLLGEGAAFFALRRRSDEFTQRSQRTRGFILGVGQSNDAAGVTSPDLSGEGVAFAITRALENARIAPEDVSAIQAHGSGTRLNDTTEAAAFRRVFGARMPPVFATKSALGHSLGATGAIELCSLLLALRDQRIPPNVGLVVPDPSLRLDTLEPVACQIQGEIGISLTLGFGGFNTCIVVQVI